MRRQAATAVPAECCGALIGEVRGQAVEVRALIPVDNDVDRDNAYRIDADAVVRLERYAQCAGLQLLGFYHSHPMGPATPSHADVALASPGFIYAIVQAHSGSVRLWRLADDRGGFRELAVRLHASAS